jgi:hypothetical protein
LWVPSPEKITKSSVPFRTICFVVSIMSIWVHAE